MLRKLRSIPETVKNGRKPRVTGLFGVLAVAVAGLFQASAASAATVPTGVFEGNAYSTTTNLNVGPVAAALGNTAYIACPCLGTKGETLINAIDALSAGDNGAVLKSGAVRATVYTSESELTGAVTEQNSASIVGLNALNGLITADGVAAVANTEATLTSNLSNSDGSQFLNLRVNGLPIGANVAPNTTINLPGIGTVTLKKLSTFNNGIYRSLIVVDMITIDVTTQNSFNLPIGAKIVVGHAYSGFQRRAAAPVVGGLAYATLATQRIGDDLRSRVGQTALQGIPCVGTAGQTLTQKIVGLGLPPVLSLGTGTTTAFGGPINGTGDAEATLTSTVANVGLLNGLISATSIKAVAQTKIVNGVRIRSTAGSQFAGLKVLGITLPVNVAPNTTINLPGIGKVVLNQQIIPPANSSAMTEVNAIHVYVTTANLLNLPIGAGIIVGHAAAGADPR